MSLLSYTELLELQKKGVITNSLPKHVNSASIDVTLGITLMVECKGAFNEVSLRDREQLHMRADSTEAGYLLQPGEFVLAHTEQVFHLPAYLSCEYKLKSSLARVGLEHLTSGWCDAGWHGSVLTLELKNMTNHHAIRIQRGDRIGQVVFFTHSEVPEWASYAKRGRYNDDLSVTGVKP